MKTVNLEYTNIPVLLPDIDFFLNKIESNEPFQFIRVNHGYIDSFHYAYNDYDILKKELIDGNYKNISKKLLDSFDDKEWGTSHWHGKRNLIWFEYSTILIDMLINPKKFSSNLDIGISLGVGLNTHWGVHYETHPVQLSRAKFAKILTEVSSYNYFYSGVIKHYTIKKETNKIFELLNLMNYDVIFLGPKYFEKHKNSFSIKNFNFIEIPIAKAINQTEEYIEQIVKIKKNTSNPVILFTQCGPVMISKIIYELVNYDIKIIDVGRSFDILIKEEFVNGNLAEKCWTFLDESHLNNYVDNLRK